METFYLILLFTALCLGESLIVTWGIRTAKSEKRPRFHWFLLGCAIVGFVIGNSVMFFIYGIPMLSTLIFSFMVEVVFTAVFTVLMNPTLV